MGYGMGCCCLQVRYLVITPWYTYCGYTCYADFGDAYCGSTPYGCC